MRREYGEVNISHRFREIHLLKIAFFSPTIKKESLVATPRHEKVTDFNEGENKTNFVHLTLDIFLLVTVSFFFTPMIVFPQVYFIKNKIDSTVKIHE